MLHPAEQTHSSFIELDCFIELSFIVEFISLLPQLLIGHKSTAALERPYFLVIFSVVEESVLQIDWKLVEYFSGGSGLRETSFCS